MKIAIFWHRRDLRLEDNAGLHHALRSGLPVLPLFIFDRQILDHLHDHRDRRVTFIHQQICRLSDELAQYGSTLCVRYGRPEEVWEELLRSYEVAEVYTNRDYEPYAQARDKALYTFFQARGIVFRGYKDQCIFEKDEVLKDNGTPYTVFTPYSHKWHKKLNIAETDEHVRPYPVLLYAHAFFQTAPAPIPALADMGFEPATDAFPASDLSTEILRHYADKRDFPSVAGTTRLSVHLRFGTVSVRALVRAGLQHSEKWLTELIWRDFYMMILYHFPHAATSAFNPRYDHIAWKNDPAAFEAWCQGRTGYPIVDAGMRELLATGFMHNRVRMITASFLTKHLLTDWRMGEAWFARHLLDFDLSANNGGWQWAAGSGCDAAPYFRIFNPTEQTKKFDPELRYIRRWVPEYGTIHYPKPIIEHVLARERCLSTYKAALDK